MDADTRLLLLRFDAAAATWRPASRPPTATIHSTAAYITDAVSPAALVAVATRVATASIVTAIRSSVAIATSHTALGAATPDQPSAALAARYLLCVRSMHSHGCP